MAREIHQQVVIRGCGAAGEMPSQSRPQWVNILRQRCQGGSQRWCIRRCIN
jgi:hypothetical protein